MAVLLCLWVVVLIPFNRGLNFRSRDGGEYNALVIMVLYLFGGLVVGALFGSMIRVLRWKAAAFSLGVAAMIPFGAAILATENHFSGWTRLETITLVIVAIAFGGPGGLIIREFVLRPSKRGDHVG